MPKIAFFSFAFSRLHCFSMNDCSIVRGVGDPILKNSDKEMPKVLQSISSLSIGGQRFF